MRISKNLIKAYNGYFYFTYTYPRWLRLLDPTLTIYFRMSLKTKDLSKAHNLVMVFLLIIEKYLIETRKGFSLSKNKKVTIHKLLEKYRDYISEADLNTQKAVCWGEYGFEEEVIGHVESQFKLLENWNYLQYLDQREFSNLDSLCVELEAAEKEKEDVDKDKTKKSIIYSDPVGNRDAPPKSQSITISELFANYANKKTQNGLWKKKTLSTNKKRIELLIDCIGDKAVSSISKKDVRNYMDFLESREVSSGENLKTITKKTMNQYLETAKSVVRFGTSLYDEIEANYFDNPEVKFKILKSEIKKRQNWTNEELKTMFSHPIYHEKKKINHPYNYWLPLLALFTGARLNELCSLHVADIRKTDDFHFISLNLDQPEKSIKTSEARDIPVHQTLIDLGFLEMIALMKKPEFQFIDDQGYNRVWRGTKLALKEDSYKKNPSDWFNNKRLFPEKNKKPENFLKGFKYQHGFEFPKNEMKDFHSFRHSFATFVEQEGMPRSTRFQLTGHLEGDPKRVVGDIYNHGKTLPMLNEALQKVNFKQLLCEVKPFFEIYNKNILREKVKPK